MEDENDYVTTWAVFDKMANKQGMRAYAQIKDDGLQDDYETLEQINMETKIQHSKLLDILESKIIFN